ncbi:MAG TPA: DUF3040 domain-containing protein [Candidatus Corynebacterium gallistercoris]|uniref:DUF3040 domain-containing protein n=1 Tax=Candidatus Corynebacterium gallistercoris TaxID=2838530 RepID=A0A9D1UQK1_9CORY|nr:DUF3040 domain-containing protein [Candidatus Corynebacterium gallistercoris]
MALSEQEQRMLAEIEQALIAEDPRLAKQASRGDAGGVNFTIQSVALIMLGLVGLIGGIALAQNSLWFVAVSVLGFLVMFAGGLLAFRSGGKAAAPRSTSSKNQRKAAIAGSGGGFGDKMEDKFRRRFEG